MSDPKVNALVRVGQSLPVSNIGELGKLGSWLAKSGMFGCDRAEQGVVLALACHVTGMNPIELKENYHLIDGNLSKRADAMLASLLEHGGEYEILARTHEKAEIKISCGKANGTFSLSWGEAQQEPFVWGKEDKNGKRKLKKNWATPRARMQMLWARVVSDGVRACCPQACKGTYTPEEIQDFDRASGRGEIIIGAEEVEVQKPDGTKVTPPPEPPKPEPAKSEPAKPAESKESKSAAGEEKVDYTKMPIGKFKGTHFKEFSINQLQQIVNADPEAVPEITDKHKKNAQGWLKKKQEAGSK